MSSNQTWIKLMRGSKRCTRGIGCVAFYQHCNVFAFFFISTLFVFLANHRLVRAKRAYQDEGSSYQKNPILRKWVRLITMLSMITAVICTELTVCRNHSAHQRQICSDIGAKLINKSHRKMTRNRNPKYISCEKLY
jgi:hypothetical protein